MTTLRDKLTIKTTVCTLTGITPGRLYTLCNIYRPYFKQNGSYGENILFKNCDVIYIGHNVQNYYFKNVEDDRSIPIHIMGSPYDLRMDDADVVVPKNLMSGCEFLHKGHNSWFDVYRYTQDIETLDNEESSKYKVVTTYKDYKKPLAATMDTSIWFNSNFIKSYIMIIIMDVHHGTKKGYMTRDINIGTDNISSKISGDEILKLSDIEGSIVIENGPNLHIAIGG